MMKRWMIATAVLGATAGTTYGQAAPPPAPVPPQPQRIDVFVADQQAIAAPATPVRLAGKKEKVTYLGTVTSSAPATLREQLKLPRGVGLVVDSVEAKTAAEAAGIKQHDVIEKLNEQWLINTEQFTALLRSMKIGDEVTLSIIRQGERQAVKAKLGEKEIDAGPPQMNVTQFQTQVMQPAALGDRYGNFDNLIAGAPVTAVDNVLVRVLDGRQTTEWADGQVRIMLESDGEKLTKVTVKDARTDKIMSTGAPPGPNDAMFEAMPELKQKLQKAQEAAAKPMRRLDLLGLTPAGGGRGKVVRWQDDDHVLVLRRVGKQPMYLLALSTKDGRAVYDGPVQSEEQRKSVPAAISEQFEMLLAYPEMAKEFGTAAAVDKK